MTLSQDDVRIIFNKIVQFRPFYFAFFSIFRSFFVFLVFFILIAYFITFIIDFRISKIFYTVYIFYVRIVFYIKNTIIRVETTTIKHIFWTFLNQCYTSKTQIICLTFKIIHNVCNMYLQHNSYIWIFYKHLR